MQGGPDEDPVRAGGRQAIEVLGVAHAATGNELGARTRISNARHEDTVRTNTLSNAGQVEQDERRYARPSDGPRDVDGIRVCKRAGRPCHHLIATHVDTEYDARGADRVDNPYELVQRGQCLEADDYASRARTEHVQRYLDRRDGRVDHERGAHGCNRRQYV
jgi:hypothetical protein